MMKTASQSARPVAAILLLSLVLNLWGIHWGLPQRWHPDEIVWRAEAMFDDRTLNHRYFAYGGLHYYEVMAGAVLPVRVAQKLVGRFDDSVREGLATLFARFLSVLMAVGIVGFVYLMGLWLFDRRAGLWAALFLALSMGFVNLAHFATTEIPSMFWFTLSCLMSAGALKREGLRWYLLAGLCAGLSAAVKYIGGISLLTLVVAHALSEKRRPFRWLLAGIGMSVVGFVIGNPVVVMAFPEFLEGFIKESAYNTARGEGLLPRAFLPLIIQRLPQALGWPLCLLTLAGLGYSAQLVRRREHRVAVLFVWSMAVPYYVVMGMQYEQAMRYIVPVVPVLLILAGKLAADWLASPSPALARGVLAVVVGYSALYTLAGDLAFVRDSRYLARDWVLSHVPADASIETTVYAPPLPPDRYRITERPINRESVAGEMAVAQRKSSHGILQQLLARLAPRSAEVPGTAGYTAWYEQEFHRQGQAVQAFSLGLDGLAQRQPDYLIVSDVYASPMLLKADAADPERLLLEALAEGRAGYWKATELRYRLLPGIEPVVEFANGTITIFQRQEPGI